jgi:exodeoxyribonuclease-3
MDIHDPEAWRDTLLASPLERTALAKIQQIGLQDSFRIRHPHRHDYSWWDYRAASFRRNLGLRIDLILLSDALVPHCEAADIDPIPRKHERPSDHAPVWVSLKTPTP